MIYTAVVSFEPHKIYRLIESLCLTGYDDRIHLTIVRAHHEDEVMVLAVMNKITSHFNSTYGVNFTFDPVEKDGSCWRFGTEKCFLSFQHTYLEQLALDNPEEYILRTDGFDILFQTDPRNIIPPDHNPDTILVGYEGMNFEQSECNMGWLYPNSDELFDKCLKGKPVICSGAYLAKGKLLSGVEHLFTRQLTMADQPEFMVIIRELEAEGKLKIQETSEFTHLHDKQHNCTYHHGVVLRNGKPPAVLHFNGGEWATPPDLPFPLNMQPKQVMNIIHPEQVASNKVNRLINNHPNAGKPTISAYISTKDRHTQTLSLAIMSVIQQTQRPDELIILDDSDPAYDYQNDPVFGHLAQHALKRGIAFNGAEGKKKGQVFNHEHVRTTCTSDYIIRLDDDVVLDADCFKELIECLESDVEIGAVGARVMWPNNIGGAPALASNNIELIKVAQNRQWYTEKLDEQVVTEDIDHLYGACFAIRRLAGVETPYELNTKKCFREETIFTNRMIQKGWKLGISTNATATHYQMPKGQSKDPKTEADDWAYDEQVFHAHLDLHSIKLREVRPIHGFHGIGDGLILRRIMPEILAKNKDKLVIIGTPRPDMFADFLGEDVIAVNDMNFLASVCQQNEIDVNSLSVYHEGCSKLHLDPHLHIEDAYRAIYKLDEEEDEVTPSK